MSKIAAIDLGTNTVRLLVAEPDGALFNQLYSGQIITRLGEELHVTGRLKKEAMERTVRGIVVMLDGASAYRPFRLMISATSAGREAANTVELADMIKAATGAELRVIPWEEEARLSLLGAGMALDEASRRFILFDVGGGSTEYILSENGLPAGLHGTNLGVVRLAETYLKRHPVSNDEYDRMVREIEPIVDEAFTKIGAWGDEMIVGTAGTVTSLAAIALNLAEYIPAKVNNFKLTAKNLENIRKRLSAMTIKERSRISVLQNGREDLIIPGAAIVEATVARSGQDHIVVTDYGLREGLILDMMAKGRDA